MRGNTIPTREERDAVVAQLASKTAGFDNGKWDHRITKDPKFHGGQQAVYTFEALDRTKGPPFDITIKVFRHCHDHWGGPKVDADVWFLSHLLNRATVCETEVEALDRVMRQFRDLTEHFQGFLVRFYGKP